MGKSDIKRIILAAAAAAVFFSVPAYAKEQTMPEGLFVGEASLGGMTEGEARQMITAEEERLMARKVTLTIAGKTATTTAGELGLSWSNREAADEALDKAVEGNLVQRYMTRKDMEKSPVHVPMETALEDGKVDEFIRRETDGQMEEPQNAAIIRENGAFRITPGVSGKVVDIAATREALEHALQSAAKDEVMAEAVVAEREPEIREEDLASIGDVLGSFTTDFSSSGASRSGNLANGASKINGHVLMPGETLSGYECMHPFTTANGYYTAAAYEGGRVVDSIGGGVCQIATTLYNAALRAELQITQRQNHSMIVGYVKPSMDAAIAGTVKDIKITNNYSTPIYVEGYTESRKLTFTIYGKETRPANRSVEYVSETLSSFSAGEPTEQVDPSMAPGSRRQVQSAHRGVKSRLWKVVTVDGVETERTLLHTDTYNASKAIVLVGPPAPAPAPTAAAQPEMPAIPPAQPEATEPSKAEGIEGGPGISMPAQTPAHSETASEETPAQPETAEPVQTAPESAAPASPESAAPTKSPAQTEPPASAAPSPEGSPAASSEGEAA